MKEAFECIGEKDAIEFGIFTFRRTKRNAIWPMTSSNEAFETNVKNYDTNEYEFVDHIFRV